MQPIDHARKIQKIAERIARHVKKLTEAQAELCEALQAAAHGASDNGLLTARETGEVVAPKDEDGK